MKKIYQITSLDHKSLDHSSFYQLIKESQEEIADFAQAHQAEAIYGQKSEALKTLLADLEASLHQSRSSKVTGSLDAADRERDDAVTTLFSLVRAFSRVRDMETSLAYTALADLLKNYKDLTKTTYEKETEQINHLLGKLKEESYQLALAQLHLTAHVEALKNAQSAFETLYQERLNEASSKTLSQTKKLRSAISETYDTLVDLTAITAYAYPDRPAFAQLRDQLNAIRKPYKLVKKSSTPKQDKENLKA